MDRISPDKFYTVPEVAKHLNISRQWAHQLCATKKLYSIQVNRNYIVQGKDILDYKPPEIGRPKKGKVSIQG